MLGTPGTEAANLFRKSLYVYLLFNCIQLLPAMPTLYGGGSWIIPYHYTRFSVETLVNLLSLPALENLYWLFFLFQALACLCGLFSVAPRICAVVVWLTTVNLNNRVYLMNTGGEQLVNILLFYLMFVSSGKEERTPVRNVFDNTFIAACKIQVLMVYALSALFKILQPEWRNGSALFYVFQMDEFTLPFLKEWSYIEFFVKVLTYFSLLYQLLFPALIFTRKVKKPLLIAGTALHVGIAFCIGLFNFSLVMICCYSLFAPDAWAGKWNRRFSFRKTSG